MIMKKISLYIACAAILFSVTSCSFFEADTPSNNGKGAATAIEGIPPEIKEKIAAQDSLMQTLVCKVDTLAKALNDSKAEIGRLNESLQALQSPKSTWGYMTLAAIILSVIALVLSIIKSKGVNRTQVGEQIKQALDNSSRLLKLREDVDNLSKQRGHSTNQQTYYGPQNYESRIKSLEYNMAQVVQCINAAAKSSKQGTSPASSSSSHNSYDTIRTGYANINSGRIFTRILDSAQEGCVFSIKFKNADKGEFTIISLDKIKSRNGWQEVVEYTGAIEDAMSFKVEEYGICEKYDQDAWQVTKKLKIKLLK